jgi:hypothetical protein
MEIAMSRHGAAFAIGLLAICSAGAGWAQQSRGGPAASDPNNSSTAFIVATAREWGGKQGDVFTCDEWKQYLKRMYNLADMRHRGFIDAEDFEIIKHASLVFAKASFDYFDTAGKGRVTQKEFIATPSQFFALFDKKNTCKVTTEDIRQATAQATQQPTPRRSGGGGRGLLH